MRSLSPRNPESYLVVLVILTGMLMVGQVTPLIADPSCATNTCKNTDAIYLCVDQVTSYYQYLDCFYCDGSGSTNCDSGIAGVACNTTMIQQQFTAVAGANTPTCPCSTYLYAEAPFVTQSSWNSMGANVWRCAGGGTGGL